MTGTREPERLLTIAEAAAATNYDEPTIRRWLASGLRHIAGPPGRRQLRSKDVRIKQSDLWAWVDAMTVVRGQTPVASTAAGKPRVAPRGATGGLSAWRQAREK